MVAHDESRRFDAEDLRVMTNLGTFAAAAQTFLSLNATLRIASIVEGSDDAILSKDLNGVITTWNRSVRMRKHGSRVDISLTVSPVSNAQGKIIGASKIARDLTKQKLK